MENKISINTTDVIKTILYAQNRNKFNWFLFIFIALLLNVVSFIGLWAMGFPSDEVFKVISNFLMLILTFYIITFILTILASLLNPKWRKGRLGEHIIEINDNGIIESTEYNRSEIYWSSINAIQIKSDALYFKFSGSEYFLIPKRSFKTVNEWSEFVDKFHTEWLSNKNS